MKRSRFTEEPIIGMLREQEAGMKTADVCRKHGISEATFYKFKAKYGGMDVSDARKLKALEEENARLKKRLDVASIDCTATTVRVRRSFGSRIARILPPSSCDGGERLSRGGSTSHREHPAMAAFRKHGSVSLRPK